jgi:DNA primase
MDNNGAKEPRADIELVRENSRIEDIAARYVQLSQTGSNLVGLCPSPSHSEQKASFYIYPETQSFFCFGCSRGGDVFDLVMMKEDVDFAEALSRLAAWANISLEINHSVGWEERHSVIDALTVATDYYHQSMIQDNPSGNWCRKYLVKRGVLTQSIETLKIGFASGHGLLPYLKERGIQENIAIKAGLVREQDFGLSEFFHGRIIFPYLEGGKTVYLSGRSIGQAEPKYLGLPGSKPLYRSTLKHGGGKLIIVEGPMDAILLRQWGYSVIALSGTALKSESVKQLTAQDYSYIVLDSDAGGMSGSVALLGQLFPKAKAAHLPEIIDDPADFVVRGHTKEEFDALLAKAEDFVEFSIGQIPRDTDKLVLSDLLKPVMTNFADLNPVKTEAYLSHRIATRFDLKAKEIDAYRSAITQLRKEVRLEETGNKQAPVSSAAPVDSEDAVNMKIEKAKAAARTVLEAPDPIEVVKIEMRRLGYGGDLKPPLITYLAATSRLLEMRRGSLPVHLLLTGPSGAGKSFTKDIVLTILPPEAYHVIDAGSPRVLIYDDSDLRHKLLVFSEADSLPAGEDNPAASAIRNLLQDHFLHYQVVTRDPETGEYIVTEITKPGPTVLLATSVHPLGNQLDTRLFTNDVPDSKEQLDAALLAQAEIEISGSKIPDPAFIEFQKYLQLKTPVKVVIPYVRELTDAIKKQASAPRILRDFQRILSLIKCVALLRQFRRAVDNQGRIIATIDDYKTVRELINEMYIGSTSGATEKVKKLVNKVIELDKITPRQQITNTSLAKQLKTGVEQVRRMASKAKINGWIINREKEKFQPADYFPGETMPDSNGLPEALRYIENHVTAEFDASNGKGCEPVNRGDNTLIIDAGDAQVHMFTGLTVDDTPSTKLGETPVPEEQELDYSKQLGMSKEKALKIWRREGAPVIHLGPGHNCFDLDNLLSNSDVPEFHMIAIRTWLEEAEKRT